MEELMRTSAESRLGIFFLQGLTLKGMLALLAACGKNPRETGAAVARKEERWVQYFQEKWDSGLKQPRF